ncbi:hypothetical protein ABPG72_020310 [Tetrahymena utriculariae]
MNNLKNCSISLPMKNQQPIEQSIKLLQANESSKLKQQQLKQKIDKSIQKKPTPQIFQDTSNLPQAHLIYLNNQGLTPGSQQPPTTFGAKWSPVKAAKVQADEDFILSQRNQNSANAQENVKNYQFAQRKNSKENKVQSVIAQNNIQISQQKAYHHHKNFQSCGGINLGQFNQQMHSQLADQDKLQSPNQSVKNSRMLNSTHSTNNFILNRKDSGNLIKSQNGYLNDSHAPVSNGNSQHNLNINSISNICAFNPLSNMSSPLNQSINAFLQSTRHNKQIEEVAYKQHQLPQNDQQKQVVTTLNQFSQSHRVAQVQSKSISSIQQIGINLEQLNSPQSNLQEKTRSFTPNQRAANRVENKIKKNQNCFLNNQLISNSTRAQKQNFIQYSNYPMNLIEEENIFAGQMDKPTIKNSTGPSVQKLQEKKIFSEDTFQNDVKQVSLKQLNLNNLQGQSSQNLNISNHLQNSQPSKVNSSNNNTTVQTPQISSSSLSSQNALIQQLLAPFQSVQQQNQQQQQLQQQQLQKYQQYSQQSQLIQPKNQQQQLHIQQTNLYQPSQNTQQQYSSVDGINNISNNNINQNSSTNKFVFDQYCIHQKKLSTHDYGTNQNATIQKSSQNLIINNSNNFNSNKIFNQSSQNFMMASAQNSVKNQVPNLNLNFEQSVSKIQSNTGSASNRSSTPSLLQAIISPQCRQQMACVNPLNDKSSLVTPPSKFIPTNLQFQDGQNIGITTLLNNQMNLNYKQVPNNTNIQNSKSNNSNITTIISANNNNNNVKQKIQNNNSNNISNQQNQSNNQIKQNTPLNLNQTKEEQNLINILGYNFQNCEYECTPINQNNQGLQSSVSYGSSQNQQIPHHQSSKSLSAIGNKNNFAKNADNPQNQQNNSYFNVIQDIIKSVEKNSIENNLQKTPKVEISLKANTPSTPQMNSLSTSPQLIQKQQQKERQNSSNIQLPSLQDSTKNQIDVFQVGDFKQSTSTADEVVFKINKKEKLNTEAIDTNTFLPLDTYKNIRTEVSSSNNGQIFLLSQNQQIKAEQSDSFYYQQKRRKYNVKDFEFIKLLGQGVFGQVHMVRDKKTKGIFALKLIDKQMIQEKEMETQLQRELNIHSSYSNHENVLECLGYFEDEKYYYLLLEYAADGTCASLIENLPMKRLTEQQSCSIVKQILESINYLHKNKIIHRDLKLENVLIQNGKVKLCDFGCATFCDSPPYQRRRSFCGTLDYVSPEMIQDQIYDKEIDIWAIGVIAFELCSGFAPFTQFNDQQTYQAIQDVKHVWPKCFSEELKDFIKKIFVVDPTQRATANQLLYHDWILKHENLNLKSA